MVKISDFLSTEQNVAIQNNAYAQETQKQLADDGLQAEGQYVNNQLQEASQEKAQLKSKAMQANQLKAQEKYQLNNIFGNLQEVQLKTINTLAAIDEQNRKQQEAALASASVLETGVNYGLQAKKTLNDIIANSASDGSDVLSSFQDWHNNFFVEAEKKAPNSKAIAALKNMNAQNLAEFGGKAIDAADKLRTNHAVNLVNASVESSLQELRENPESNNITGVMGSAKAIFDSQNINPLVVDDIMKQIGANVVSAQVDGLVGKMDFAGAKSLLSSDGITNILSPEQISKQYRNVISAQKESVEQIHVQTLTSDAMVKYQNNNLSEYDAKLLPKEVQKQIGLSVVSNLQDILAGDEDRSIKATRITSTLKSNSYQPPEVFEYMSSVLRSGTDQEKVLVANSLDMVFDDKETKHIIEKVNKDLFIESQLIAQNSRYMKDTDAVVQAQNLLRSPVVITKEELSDFNKTLATIDIGKIQDEAGIIPEQEGLLRWVSEAETSPELMGTFREVATLVRSKGLSEDDSLKMAYKHVGALYSTSEVNGVSEIMEISPERVYPTESLRAEFDTQVSIKLDELAAEQGWELSEDKRSYTSTIDGVKYKSPLKIMPVPSVTYFQHKSQSPVTTWMIIDGRDGNDFTRFTTISVDASVTREAARQNISTLSANKNNVIKRLDKELFNSYGGRIQKQPLPSTTDTGE